MFRESSAIDSERTAASVRSLYTKYAGNENWFDGTPDSVDRRIAQAKRIANLCKAASVRLAGRNAGSQYIALAHEMDSDRTALEGLRRDLLTAATDREAERYDHPDWEWDNHMNVPKGKWPEEYPEDLPEWGQEGEGEPWPDPEPGLPRRHRTNDLWGHPGASEGYNPMEGWWK